MHDYYQLLGLGRDAREEDIKKAFRKMAFECHPDRNPGDPQAEERFKLVSEAYTVLMDPALRAQYDFSGTAGGRPGSGFGYTQEEIFRNLFTNPQVNKVFQDLFAEFSRAGLRADQTFYNNIFFKGRGGWFVGGLLFFGTLSMAAKSVSNVLVQNQPGFARPIQEKPGLLARLGQKAFRWALSLQAPEPSRSLDVSYDLALSREEAQEGKHVEVAVGGPGKGEVLKVRIPPEARSGMRLRVRGKGNASGPVRGDLYLVLHVS